jgi:ATP/maltotriose-dependent transcriptional regulator MalT
VNLLGRAVELLPDGPGRVGPLVALGEALHLAGETERARAALEEGAALARTAGDAHHEWLARIELVSLRLDTEPEGAAEAALREGEAAAAARETAGDHEVLAMAWDLIATGHEFLGHGAEWRQATERALAHARETGDLALEVPILSRSAGPIVYGSFRVEEGLRYADDVLERLGHVPEVQGFGLHVRAHMLARRGESKGAFEAVSAWRRHKRELGQEAMYAQTSGCLWDVCFWAKEWERGEEALREGLEMLERMGRKAYASTIAARLGEAAVRLGRVDEAKRLSETSEELGASDDVYNETVWRRVRAEVLAARGDLAGAETFAREAAAIAGGAGYLDDAALAWLDVAQILRAAGDGHARDAAVQAVALFERKGNLVGAGWGRGFLDDAPGSDA